MTVALVKCKYKLILEMIAITKFYTKYKKVIYEILFCFILCGVIGWIYETAYVLIASQMLTDRGILFISHIGNFPVVWGLPFILMYGVGGALLIWCFKPFAKKPVLLFFVCVVSMTIFEFFTSYFYELIWGQILWDYSSNFMNFQGRICLGTSLMWGILGLLSVKVFGPFFHRLYAKIKNEKVMHIVLIALVLYIAVCYVLRPIMFENIIDHLPDA